MSVIDNLSHIDDRIRQACHKAGRDPQEVRLLLATKTVPAEQIATALDAGYLLIGENKVQEIKEKYEVLKDHRHETHFIGHLQSNKIKELIRYDVTCIQSLDRVDLAEKLHQRLVMDQRKMKVFLQVNTSGESSKFGVSPAQAAVVVQQMAAFDTLQIKGLMTIGLFSAEGQKVRACFQRLRKVQQEINALRLPNVAMKELSMGMSNDLEIAIEEGATIIRVGTAIFGQRQYPDSYYWNENSQ